MGFPFNHPYPNIGCDDASVKKFTMLLKIKTKSDKAITLETPDGKIVNVGYKKNGILLYKLSQLEVGAEIDLAVKQSDITQGYSGNLYVDIGDAFMKSKQIARQYLLEEARLDKQFAALDA